MKINNFEKERLNVRNIEVFNMLDEGYVKCPRCWMCHAVFINFDFLCDRCQNVILKIYPNHEAAAGILNCLESQAAIFSSKEATKFYARIAKRFREIRKTELQCEVEA